MKDEQNPTRDGRPRSTYRLITIDPHGSILSVIVLSALNDMEAITLAGLLAAQFAMDLWDGLRFVEHFAIAVPEAVGSVLDDHLIGDP